RRELFRSIGAYSGCGLTAASDTLYLGAASTCLGCFTTIYAGTSTITAASDENFKHSINPITCGSCLVKNISPIAYYWKPESTRLSTEIQQIGFSAQNVEKAFENLPEDAKHLKDYVKGIVYKAKDLSLNVPQYELTEGKLFPFVVQALKETIEKVEALQAEIDGLKNS